MGPTQQQGGKRKLKLLLPVALGCAVQQRGLHQDSHSMEPTIASLGCVLQLLFISQMQQSK